MVSNVYLGIELLAVVNMINIILDHIEYLTWVELDYTLYQEKYQKL